MSLLLDALKKAADDKQKASVDDSSCKRPADGTLSVEDIGEAGVDAAEELVLDELPEHVSANKDVTEPDVTATESSEHVQYGVDVVIRDEEDATEITGGLKDKQRPVQQRATTITDDGLSMLIHKTNREVKKGKRIMVAGVVLLSLLILVSGAIFYYLDMQSEIASLERKHQIAMQSMRLKTNKEKTPDNSTIIRNLVSEGSDLEEKVRFAKQQMEKINARENERSPMTARTPRSNSSSPSAQLSIQRTKTVDPVGEELDAAWSLYDSGRYEEAAEHYNKVLSIEDNNRDAMLGLAAIAIIENDTVKAKYFYQGLLEQDPRDSVVIAALSALDSNENADVDENYLLSMLKKNPGAHHLSFALGNAYAQQGKWESAQQYYFDAWQGDVENTDYLFNLAVSLDQLGKQEQALNFYQQCLLKSEDKKVSFSRSSVKKRISEISGS